MGDDARSFQTILTEHVELLLWSDRYLVRPIDFGLPNEMGYYEIRIPRTGPALLLELPRMFERDGVQSIGMGSLYYQPQYQDPLTGNWRAPPPALRQDFSKVKDQLRRACRRDTARRPIRPCGDFVRLSQASLAWQ